MLNEQLKILHPRNTSSDLNLQLQAEKRRSANHTLVFLNSTESHSDTS